MGKKIGSYFTSNIQDVIFFPFKLEQKLLENCLDESICSNSRRLVKINESEKIVLVGRHPELFNVTF